MTMTKFDIPGAPAAAVAQINASLGKPDIEESCMSPAEAKAGIAHFARDMRKGDCKA